MMGQKLIIPMENKQINVIAVMFIIPVILWDIDTKDEMCHL